MLKTVLITNRPDIASDAEAVGVNRIMVDLESIGKKERQASRNTFISTHKIEDITAVREALVTAELIVRINPWYANSKSEIDAVIKRGAQRIMIPMITSMPDFAECLSYIANRAKILPLIETEYSMRHLAEIVSLPAVDEIYIGLNDLHLSLGMSFLFEPLAIGLLDDMAAIILAEKKSFGFGGIAMIGSGELPAEKILAEHERLGSNCVILSSRFGRDTDIENPAGRKDRIEKALYIMSDYYKQLGKRSKEETQKDCKETSKIILAIASTINKKNSA